MMVPEEKKNGSKLETQMAVILNEIEHIGCEITEIKENMKAREASNKAELVRREEFEPVQRVVYAMVTLVLTAVIGAIIAIVVNKPIF